MDQYAAMAAALLAPQHQREQFILQQALQAASLTQQALVSLNSGSYPSTEDSGSGGFSDPQQQQQQHHHQLMAHYQQCNSPHLLTQAGMMNGSQHMLLSSYGMHGSADLGGISPGSEMDMMDASEAHLFLERQSSSDAHLFIERHSSNETATASFKHCNTASSLGDDASPPTPSAHLRGPPPQRATGCSYSNGSGAATAGSGGEGTGACRRPSGSFAAASTTLRGGSPELPRGSSPPSSSSYRWSPHPHRPYINGSTGTAAAAHGDGSLGPFLRGSSPPPPPRGGSPPLARGASPPPALYGGSPSTTRGSSPPTRGSSPPPAESKSDKAKLVDVWIESALLISKPPLDRRHFDRETRQNLKKMRPVAAQQVLTDVAGREWSSLLDMEIGREVHRMVSHAKAQDKYSNGAPFNASAAGGATQAAGAANGHNTHGGNNGSGVATLAGGPLSGGSSNDVRGSDNNHQGGTSVAVGTGHAGHNAGVYSNIGSNTGSQSGKCNHNSFTNGFTNRPQQQYKFDRSSLNSNTGNTASLFSAQSGTSCLPSPSSGGGDTGGHGSSDVYGGGTPNVSFNRLSGGSSRNDCDVDVSISDGQLSNNEQLRRPCGNLGFLSHLVPPIGRADMLSDVCDGAGGLSPTDKTSGLVSYASSSSSSGHNMFLGGGGGSFRLRHHPQNGRADGHGSSGDGSSSGGGFGGGLSPPGIIGHVGRLGDPKGDEFVMASGARHLSSFVHDPARNSIQAPLPDNARKLYWWEG